MASSVSGRHIFRKRAKQSIRLRPPQSKSTHAPIVRPLDLSLLPSVRLTRESSASSSTTATLVDDPPPQAFFLPAEASPDRIDDDEGDGPITTDADDDDGNASSSETAVTPSPSSSGPSTPIKRPSRLKLPLHLTRGSPFLSPAVRSAPERVPAAIYAGYDDQILNVDDPDDRRHNDDTYLVMARVRSHAPPPSPSSTSVSMSMASYRKRLTYCTFCRTANNVTQWSQNANYFMCYDCNKVFPRSAAATSFHKCTATSACRAIGQYMDPERQFGTWGYACLVCRRFYVLDKHKRPIRRHFTPVKKNKKNAKK